MTSSRLLFRIAVPVAVAVLVVVAGWRSFFMVDESRITLVQSFGNTCRPAPAQAGFHWKWPWQTAVPVDRRVRLLTFEPREKLTRDHEPVVIEPYACWKVSADAVGNYALAVRDEDTAERLLRDLVWAALDRALADHPLTDWLRPVGDGHVTSRLPLAAMMIDVTQACQREALARFGIDLLDVQLRRLSRPERMKGDLVHLMQTDRLRQARQRSLDMALRQARIEIEARGEANRILAEAEMDAEQIRSRGEQEARRMEAEARRINPELTDYLLRLEEYQRLTESASPGTRPAKSTGPARTKPPGSPRVTR
ncbi:MAG TPA: SPFH domain-containing protein [Phycisphaerae bacterium]|nr:SPFH domain-containing protein [Phycisphaerae bacterium]